MCSQGMGVIVIKFKTINQYYQSSECGRFLISHARSGDKVVFTLIKDGVLIATEKCNDFASERVQALNDLKLKAI